MKEGLGCGVVKETASVCTGVSWLSGTRAGVAKTTGEEATLTLAVGAEVSALKSEGGCTSRPKTALVVYVQTMVALAMLPNIGPAGMKVEALSGTAGKQLHMVGTVQVDPQSVVLIWNVALATGTPLVETSTCSFQRHGGWLCHPESL